MQSYKPSSSSIEDVAIETIAVANKANEAIMADFFDRGIGLSFKFVVNPGDNPDDVVKRFKQKRKEALRAGGFYMPGRY